ncbi:hypothetical protein [Shewanella marisflavi]|uniref:Lipoprotein n=1 Tax=Shewanella marisflavi TaxID=260364 RepID=A0AAC9TTT0_9GAMM|nr:hypothetical protein [Shewanella marisflavi]ASJ95325.1 hypothetical protein CFF01_01275 [Shewanella marisflavi]
MRSFIVSVALLLTVTACTEVPQWTLFYYPDAKSDAQQTVSQNADSLDKHIAGYYQQLDQCLAKGAGMVKLSQTGNGRYKCGYLCEVKDDGQLSCQRMETLVSQ